MTREILNMRIISVSFVAFVDEHIEGDFDKCIGCGICAEKCPKKVVRIRDEKAYICDTCGGDPKCVKTCPQHALTFE